MLTTIAIALLRAGGPLGRVVPLVGSWMIAGVLTAVFLLFYGYFLFFEILWSGQTPGKRAIGIRVIKDSGRPLSPSESIGRNLLRIVDQMPGFYGVGIVVALLNRQNKRLGDFVAGSLVVREVSLAELKPSWNHLEWQPAPHAPLGAARLSDDDLILIESFLQRRHDLAPEIRRRIAAEIFSRVESKLTVSAEERPEIERLLEAAVHERRAGTSV